MIKPTNAEHAEAVRKIAAMLSELSIGRTLPYTEIAEAVGYDVRGRYHYLLTKAKEESEKAMGCVYESVRSVGVKRLPADESTDIGPAALRTIKRKARRTRKRLERLNSNAMTEPAQRRSIAYQSMLGAVELVADGNKARALAAVSDRVSTTPPANILDMFKKTG